VHIDIREELAREIPDRESASGLSIEQTLISRESNPILSLPDDLHSLSHISENDRLYQVQEDILFVCWDSEFPLFGSPLIKGVRGILYGLLLSL
jgi:hypothetical protein